MIIVGICRYNETWTENIWKKKKNCTCAKRADFFLVIIPQTVQPNDYFHSTNTVLRIIISQR